MNYVIYTDGLTMRCSNEEVSHTIRHKMHRRISRTGAPQNSSAHALRLERPNAMMANGFRRGCGIQLDGSRVSLGVNISRMNKSRRSPTREN